MDLSRTRIDRARVVFGGHKHPSRYDSTEKSKTSYPRLVIMAVIDARKDVICIESMKDFENGRQDQTNIHPGRCVQTSGVAAPLQILSKSLMQSILAKNL